MRAMSKAQLVGALAEMLTSVARDDTLEGTLIYRAPQAHEKDCDFLVSAVYRVETSVGEGCMRVIGVEQNGAECDLAAAFSGHGCQDGQMSHTNLGERAPDESFEDYIERMFRLLHDVIAKGFKHMSDTATELGADVETLARVIPALSTNLTNLTTNLVTAEQEKQAAIDAKTEDDSEKAKLEGELAAIQAQVALLDPIAQQAASLVAPAGTEAAGGGAPAGGEQPAATKPRYEFLGADASTIDPASYTVAPVRVPTSLQPLYEFANDTVGGAPLGAVDGRWVVYTGAVETIPVDAPGTGAATTGAGAAGTGAGGVAS